MAKGKLFQYAALYHPKETKDQGGNDTTPPSQIVLEPKTVLAENDKALAMRVAREIPAEYDDKLDLVEIVIRPW
jgi:hypothetical protein